MVTVVVGPESRQGRKRKRNNVQNVMVDIGGEKKVVETRSFKLVGRYVLKEFQGSGALLGRIMHYDSGLYRINYEDGHSEDLISSKVKAFLFEDGDLTGEWPERKEMLNELLFSKNVNTKALMVDDTRELENANPIDSSLLSEKTNCDSADNEVVEVSNDVNADSLSKSCEGAREGEANLGMEVPLIPPPELPPSSGHIGIPEEYVSHLLSVHSFLRSFSVRLFLYPFGLDDFVGALSCSVANTLLDSVHVALLHVLKRQFERLPSDGSELTSKFLRCLDWSLLDTLTWPIYLVHYLIAMDYKIGDDWKEFYTHCLERDYYTLSVGEKLIVLQILCEDILDTEELRREMDMREESEVGVDIDTSATVGTICEPGTAHTRHTKTSACKDIEGVQIAAERREPKSSLGNHSMGSQLGGTVGNSIHEDGNGDECRLCGMDGLLVCCDGCPSSYHSRCLGLNKAHMPDGLWYCPECRINANEPKILQGTALRGGDIFGVDQHKQVFVASCDHLLVLKALINSENCARYYNRRDIPGVLDALCSKPQYAIMYSEICRGIVQYWELSPGILPCSKMSGTGLQVENKEESCQCITQLVNLLDKVPEINELENHGSHVTGLCADTTALWLTNRVQQPVLSENSLDTVTIFGQHVDSMRQQCESMKTTINEPASFSRLIGQPGPCELGQQSTPSVTKTVFTRNSNVKCNGPVNGTFLEAKASLSQELNNKADRNSCGSPYELCLYMGSSFKATGYINHYLHGDFAAAAAANLAILSCEENKVWESHSSDKHREVMCASIALQVKAFSSAAMRFFWPNTEKKLVEVPRERCSWCVSCKAPVTSKRGCLLNAAASNATRGAMKVLAGVRPLKNGGDGRLSGIATYIMFMEESLSGLVVGPFLNNTFRKQWRKQVEQATTCNAIKILMLELEENIRSIALSGDWRKLVEGFPTQSSTSQVAANAAGSTEKRRPGRHGRKHSAMVKVAVDGCLDMVTDFTWWRGGKLSKLLFRRGILPSSSIKKSARQGGKKRIPGIHYVEGNEIPKISRQLVWRSAVEMSRSVAQLALQVRYLDFHVRWGDLVRPDLVPYDGNGLEAEASAFRNAFICHKIIVEHQIKYCVAFASQKFLPSRVMKNITEIEQILDDGKERYWFSETYIPLYLIKEYEQKMKKNKPVDVLPKLQRRQLKASCKNIYSILWWKQDITARSCCSCHHDVFYKNAFKCSACQGFCHKQCATSSTDNMSKEIEHLIICKQCCETQAATRVESNHGSPTSPLLLQGQDFPNPATETKHGKLVGCKGSLASLGASEHSSEMKSANRSAIIKKKGKLNWGLIWRKKNYEDTGIDFRLRNILLRGNADRGLIKPLCRLCNQPYNADLMYIRCEACKDWFHADSVELEESEIFFLVGFKCCKCRRSKSPVCPYLDPEKKKVLEGKIERRQAAKLKISTMDFDCGIVSDRHKEVGLAYSALPRKAEVIHMAADNPSLSEGKQCIKAKPEVNYGWKNATVSGPEPRKLPIRRNVNQEKDVFCQAGPFQFEVSTPSEANVFKCTEKMRVRRSVSKENFDDGAILNSDCFGYVDMELEPQTYSSLNELLESDDGGHMNSNEPPENVIENQKSSSSLPENGTSKISYDQEKPIIAIETAIQIVPCKFCSNTEPRPDLSCQICDMWIHGLCSPWHESSSPEDGWRCGNCREWR